MVEELMGFYICIKLMLGGVVADEYLIGRV